MLWNKYREYFIFSVSLIALILLMTILRIPCPIKHLTGLSCAGCGMTRALMSALTLDLRGAFSYHPLWILLLPSSAALIILKAKGNKPAFGIVLYCTAALFFGTWIYRLISGDGVVSFDFENSVINKIIIKISELLT